MNCDYYKNLNFFTIFFKSVTQQIFLNNYALILINIQLFIFINNEVLQRWWIKVDLNPLRTISLLRWETKFIFQVFFYVNIYEKKHFI